MKPNLKEGQDYIVVNFQIFEYLSKKYTILKVKREKTINDQGIFTFKYNLKRLNLLVVDETLIKSIKNSTFKEFRMRQFSVYNCWPIYHIKDKIVIGLK